MKKLISWNIQYLAFILLFWILTDVLFVANSSRPILGFLKLSYATDFIIPILSLLVIFYIWPVTKQWKFKKRFLAVMVSALFQFGGGMLLIFTLGITFHFFIGGGI